MHEKFLSDQSRGAIAKRVVNALLDAKTEAITMLVPTREFGPLSFIKRAAVLPAEETTPAIGDLISVEGVPCLLFQVTPVHGGVSVLGWSENFDLDAENYEDICGLLTDGFLVMKSDAERASWSSRVQ